MILHKFLLASSTRSGRIFCRSLSSSSAHPLIRLNLQKPIIPKLPLAIQSPYFQLQLQPMFTAKMATKSPKKASRTVKHDKIKQKFYMELEAGEAKLEYAKKGNTLNLWHTEVPVALRGQGTAKILAQAAFAYAVEQEHQMILTCPYLKKYVDDNPNGAYKDLIIE